MKIYKKIILAFLILWAVPILAHRSPVGCSGSSLSINLYTDLAEVRIGEVVSFSVDVYNGSGSGPIVCDASDITASITTPDGVLHDILLLRTTLTNGQMDSYSNVVTYTARAEDVQDDGSLKVTAKDIGTIHQNDTNSIGGSNQSLNITILSEPEVVPVVVDIPDDVPPPASSGGGGGGGGTPQPLINIVKTPSPLALSNGPGLVTYNYTVTNVGLVELGKVSVKDDKCSQVEYVSGNTDNDNYLDLAETWIYRCVKTVSQTETNIVTASGSANGWDATDTDSATVAVAILAVPPLINIVKIPSRLTPFPFGGGEVVYTYTVANTGTVEINNVVVSDDKCSPVEYVSGDLNVNGLLEVSENWIYTCKVNLTTTTTNLGKVVGHANGITVVDFYPATVVVTAPGFPNTGLFSKR